MRMARKLPSWSRASSPVSVTPRPWWSLTIVSARVPAPKCAAHVLGVDTQLLPGDAGDIGELSPSGGGPLGGHVDTVHAGTGVIGRGARFCFLRPWSRSPGRSTAPEKVDAVLERTCRIAT